MGQYKAKDYAVSQLQNSITDINATSLTVKPGHGDRFPVVDDSLSDWSVIYLENASGVVERIKVTKRLAGSDTMTIVKGFDGDTKSTWAANDIVECRPYAKYAEDSYNHIGDTSAAHAASAISVSPTGGIGSTNVQDALAELDSEKTTPGYVDASVAAVSASLAAHLGDAVDAHDASAISYAGGTGMSATDVEGALDELATEKADNATVQTVWVPASAMIPRTTNGAATGTVETTTNKVMLKTLDFDGGAADEFAQFSVRMPKGWNEGTITAEFLWSHPSTTTNFNVVWGIQAVAVGNDDALDVAFGTAVTVQDTGGTTDDIYKSAITGALTIAGSPAEGDMVIFQAYRDASDTANDTLAVDARLHGITLFYTTTSLSDA